MGKKAKTEEERLIEESIDVIKLTIRMLSCKIADKYEEMLLEKIKEYISDEKEANADIQEYFLKNIKDKLEQI